MILEQCSDNMYTSQRQKEARVHLRNSQQFSLAETWGTTEAQDDETGEINLFECFWFVMLSYIQLSDGIFSVWLGHCYYTVTSV